MINNIKVLYYDRIKGIEGIDVNKTSESKECAIFITNVIFWIKALNFNQMSAIDVIIY